MGHLGPSVEAEAKSLTNEKERKGTVGFLGFLRFLGFFYLRFVERSNLRTFSFSLHTFLYVAIISDGRC